RGGRSRRLPAEISSRRPAAPPSRGRRRGSRGRGRWWARRPGTWKGASWAPEVWFAKVSHARIVDSLPPRNMTTLPSSRSQHGGAGTFFLVVLVIVLAALGAGAWYFSPR